MPGGTCEGNETGKPLVNGRVSGDEGGDAVTLESVCVSGLYLRGSGLTSGTVKTTSHRVGQVSVTPAEAFRLTYATFGTGSSYLKVPRSDTGTTCCMNARA